MPMTIGLIDEESLQLHTIRMVIKSNTPTGEEIPNFKNYELHGTMATLREKIVHEIIRDIMDGSISSLLIDYKIMIDTALIEGSDLYKMIYDLVPQFPLIILTDVPEACFDKAFLDSDKVYRKSDFFQVESRLSKEKVENIFRNAKRYINQRNYLSLTLEKLKEQIAEQGMTEELYRELLDVEIALKDFYPSGITKYDNLYDATKMREIIDIIDKASQLLGE